MKKKIVIILIVIWILLLTGIFLYSKTQKKVEESVEPPVIETENLSKFEFIDYTGYYDENDLKIEQIKFDEENYNTYVKISGLKNKKIENRLNKEFYDTALSFLNDEDDSVHSYPTINAFNVLSVTISGTKNSEIKTIYRNIDLTTGNEIKMTDILNTKKIASVLASLYYNAEAYSIQSEKRYFEQDLDYYDSCIKNSNKDCEKILGSKTIDEINQEIENANNYMSTLEDESLKYARSFDFNEDFYITSAGIIINNFSVRDNKYHEPIRILINENPRLFNFYYKYKTNDSIFDGSYTGKKNLMYSEYARYASNNPPSTDILEYALIHKNFFKEEEKILETESFKSYLESLDKSKFYCINDFNTYNDIIQLNQCTLTKELYEKEYKKYLADEMIKPHHSQGYYKVDSENVKCEYLKLYVNNPNVYTMYIDSKNRIYIRNNPQKASEINYYIDSKINELSKDGTAYLSDLEITENQITVKIGVYRNNYNYKEEIYETFDL